MRYSLFPFPSKGGDDAGDVVNHLRSQPRSSKGGLSSLELVEATAELLRDIPFDIVVDHCSVEERDLHLAVFARKLGCEVELGDEVKAGFFLRNDESSREGAFACGRIYRVVCENGALMECDAGQSAVLSAGGDWKATLATVVHRSFDAEGLDLDVARFRATQQQMLVAPFELLCSLEAQGLISVDEQVEIQEEFDRAADCTFYGLINAVTRIAGRLRESSEWLRSMELERLGGEVLRGDHDSPALDLSPVW